MNRNPYEFNDLDRIVHEIRLCCPGEEDGIIQWADGTCGGTIRHRAHYEMERCMVPVRFSSSVWNNVPSEIENRDPEWLYALNRHSILLNLAKAYAFTRNAAYKDTFSSMMRSFLDNTSYRADCLNTSWRSLETGIRVENWLRSKAIFKASGSPLDKDLDERMDKSLLEHKKQLLETRRAFHRLSNWGVIQDHGLFLAASYLNDTDTAKLALDRLEEEVVNQVLPDGVHWEQSPLYHCEVLHGILDTLLAARRLGIGTGSIFRSRAEKMALALSLLMKRNGTLLLQGDSDEINCQDLVYLAACLFGSPTLMARSGGRRKEENCWDMEGLDVPEASRRVRDGLLEASGNYRIDTGLMEVRMSAGNLGSGHGHLNPLHVDFTYRGATLLTDSGRYTYVDCDERRTLKDFEAHNTFILEGLEHCRPCGSWGYTGIYEILRSPSVHSGRYTLIQASHLEYLGSRAVCRRKVLSLGERTVLVLDEVLAPENESFAYKAFWHVQPGSTLTEGEGRFVICNGSSRITMLPDHGTDPDIFKTGISPFYNIMEEGQCISLSKAVPGYGTVATLISGDEDATIKRLPVELIDAKTVLNETEACGLLIRTDGCEWTVVSRSREIVNQVDILRCGSMEGYARVLVQEKGEKYPTGLSY